MQGGLIAAGADSNPVDLLLQYGILGVVVVLLIIGWLVPKYVLDRVIEENKKKDEIIQRKDEFIAQLQETMSTQAVPALIEATGVMKGLPEAENALLKQIIDLKDHVQELANRTESPRRPEGRGRG